MDQETEDLVEVALYDKDGNPVEEQVVEAQAPQEEAPVEAADVVPAKFKGKSLEDVITSYENLEKELGRKNNEVGELRKLTDQILQNQVAPQRTPVVERNEDDTPVAFEDFVENPDAVIAKAISRNKTLQEMEKNISQSRADAARAQLLENHPDVDAVIEDPNFVKWVKSKESRLRQLQTADQTNDADMASDLLDLYKQTRKVTNEEAVIERDAKSAADLKRAAVESGGTPASQKPVFRRRDLIHMKIHQPERYKAKEAEIMAAYAEGRVTN